jgi:CCR4-NOT transcription complex subunit 2
LLLLLLLLVLLHLSVSGYSQDEAQLIAADELCARGWWWHKKFRCWFIHAPNNPVVKSAANRSERGTYLFFDTNIWDVVQVSCSESCLQHCVRVCR